MLARHRGLWAALALTGVLLAPSVGNEFVYDDEQTIARGDYLHDLSRIPEFFVHPTMYVNPAQRDVERTVDTYRPITLTTLALDAAHAGREPFGYHVTNIALHLACVVLVYFLALGLLGERRRLAPWAAVIFGLAPQAAEAHVWINGRSDVLAVGFGLGALLVWRRAIESPRPVGLHVLAGLLFLAGLLSKEVLLMVVPACVLWPERSDGATSWGRRSQRVLPFVVATAAYLALRVNAIGGMRVSDGGSSIVSAMRVSGTLLFDAFREMLVPTQLHLRMLSEEYESIPAAVHWTLFGGAIVLGLVALWGRRRWPLGTWAFVWIAGTLAPVAMVAVTYWIGYGRYLYLPMVGCSVALVDVVGRLVEWRPRLRRAMALLGGAYVMVSGVLLGMRVHEYRTSEALFEGAVLAAPDSTYANGWLGLYLGSVGEYERAVGYLERAYAGDPTDPKYAVPLADTQFRLGNHPRAYEVATDMLDRREGDADSRPILYLVAASAIARESPTRSVDHLIACLVELPESVRCRDALSTTLSQHPQRATLLEHVRRRVEEPELRRLREQMAPLLGVP